MSLLWQPFVSGVVDSSGLVMRVLYTFSGNTVFRTSCYQLDSNLAKLGDAVEVG